MIIRTLFAFKDRAKQRNDMLIECHTKESFCLHVDTDNGAFKGAVIFGFSAAEWEVFKNRGDEAQRRAQEDVA